MEKLNKLRREAECMTAADRIILHYPEHPAAGNRVNLHDYHADWESGTDRAECNLGDVLSEVVVRWVCEKRGIDFEKAVRETRHLYAIGSLLQMGYQNATVWGNGFAFEPNMMRSMPHRYPLRRLDVRCVRGPRTRATLIRLGHQCPKVYGDPAVLLPLFCKPQKVPETDYLIIPHYSVEAQARAAYGDEHILSMKTTDYQSVVNRIAASRRVISGSLHGIILAEAYGVPAVFYEDRDSRFRYKYDDWYLSTGRPEYETVQSVEEGLRCQAASLHAKRIQRLQCALLKSFPADLWES